MFKNSFCLSVLLLVFAGRVSTAQVVATVGNEKITEKEFKERLEKVRKEAVNPPTPQQFLEDLVRYKVGVQEARKKDLQKDPYVIDQMEQAMYRLLVENAIGEQVKAIKITEADLRKYYEKNPEVRLSHILIEFKPDSTPEEKQLAQKRAQEILAEVLKSKRPFEELVKLYTDDVLSKTTNGDIGFQSRVNLAPPIYDTALKMKVGEIHKTLLETRYGFHIIKLTGKRTFQEANKSQIRIAVYDEKRGELFNNYFLGLKKKYKIELNKAAIQDLK